MTHSSPRPTSIRISRSVGATSINNPLSSHFWPIHQARAMSVYQLLLSFVLGGFLLWLCLSGDGSMTLESVFVVRVMFFLLFLASLLRHRQEKRGERVRQIHLLRRGNKKLKARREDFFSYSLLVSWIRLILLIAKVSKTIQVFETLRQCVP